MLKIIQYMLYPVLSITMPIIGDKIDDTVYIRLDLN